MMIFRLAFVAGTIALASPALAQSDRVQENINLSPDAPPAATYSGNINLSAMPCPDQNWNMNLPVTGVKSNSEAHRQVKDKIDAFKDDVADKSQHCPAPPH